MREAVPLVGDPNRLTNQEVATYALWCVGGAKEICDTEDVAVLCWEMAPSRFSWKRYSQFPDKDIIRFALADAKKKKYGELVQGSGADGWLLTTNGVRWVERNSEVDGWRGGGRGGVGTSFMAGAGCRRRGGFSCRGRGMWGRVRR
jgi:hypothetical protein